MIGATSNPATNVYVTAFKAPATSRFALVAINNTDESVTVQTRFDGFSCASLTPWVTDAASNLAEKPPVAGSVTGFPLILGAKSVTTFVGNGGAAEMKSASRESFEPGAVWLDTSGEPIRAHDGGFYFMGSGCTGWTPKRGKVGLGSFHFRPVEGIGESLPRSRIPADIRVSMHVHPASGRKEARLRLVRSSD
jgi:hypothetical protein